MSCLLLVAMSGQEPPQSGLSVEEIVLSGKVNMVGRGFIVANPKGDDGKVSLAATAQKYKLKENVPLVGTRASWLPTVASPSDQGYPCNSNGGANYLIHYAVEGAVTNLLKRVAR